MVKLQSSAQRAFVTLLDFDICVRVLRERPKPDNRDRDLSQIGPAGRVNRLGFQLYMPGFGPTYASTLNARFLKLSSSTAIVASSRIEPLPCLAFMFPVCGFIFIIGGSLAGAHLGQGLQERALRASMMFGLGSAVTLIFVLLGTLRISAQDRVGAAMH